MPKPEEAIPENNQKMCKCKNKGGSPGAFYGLGFIGAAVFFIMHAHTFMEGVIGILKAIVWPALISYKLLEFFKF
jgi:hypothetical protein